jgi:hypothetical protein
LDQKSLISLLKIKNHPFIQNMGEYNQIKEKIINQQPEAPSMAALKAAFDLFKLDLAKEFLTYPAVLEEIANSLDDLGTQEHLLVFLLGELPFSDLYSRIKSQFLNSDLVWEKIVTMEEIPLRISGKYFTGDNQIVFQHEKLQQVDILLENKNHPVINSLNKLQEKSEFSFSATLQKGSLFTYQGLIETSELDAKIQAVANADRAEMQPFSRMRKITREITGVALALSIAVALVGCGQNPQNNDDPGAEYGSVPPYNNSPDCVIQRAAFYNRLSRVQVGMTEEEVDAIVNPTSVGYNGLPFGSFKYSTSYSIMGFDYDQKDNVICEVVQLHYDTYWRYRTYTAHTVEL